MQKKIRGFYRAPIEDEKTGNLVDPITESDLRKIAAYREDFICYLVCKDDEELDLIVGPWMAGYGVYCGHIGLYRYYQENGGQGKPLGGGKLVFLRKQKIPYGDSDTYGSVDREVEWIVREYLKF